MDDIERRKIPVKSYYVNQLKKNRKYYVQIRTKSGKKYSAWSKVKTISKL